MPDYLKRVSSGGRILSILGCSAASIICLVLSVMLWTDMLRRHSFEHDSKPLWMAAVVVIVLGLGAGFISWRLIRRATAENGITTMPLWFIQIFGVLLLLGLSFVAINRGDMLFLYEGASVCLAMIFISRHIARKQRKAA